MGRLGSFFALNPGKGLWIGIGITVLMMVGISFLKPNLTFFSMMPKGSKQVQNLEKIINEFPMASSVIVVVDGRNAPPEEAKTRVIQAIDDIQEELKKPEYAEYVQSIYGSLDPDFIEEHGLMTAKEKDLKRMSDLYANTNLVPFITALNNDLEREYSGDEDSVADDETQLVSWVGGIEKILAGLSSSIEGENPSGAEIDEALQNYLVGDLYTLNKSQDMGVIYINLTYTINDAMDPIFPKGVTLIEKTSKRVGAESGVEVGMTGLLTVARDEMVTVNNGFYASLLAATVLIILILIGVFRIRSIPFLIGIPLLLGVFWTLGMTGFLIQNLNILTMMYMVALIGLGVDYAIHIVTAFVQERDRGKDFAESMSSAFEKIGAGIITGAITTAGAFYALYVADSVMLKELGIVAGTGILCEFFAMVIFIPSLLGMREKRFVKKGKTDPMLTRKSRIKSNFTSGIGEALSKAPLLFLLITLGLGLFFSLFAGGIRVEDNLMKLEATGLKSIELQDEMIDEFGQAPDVLYLRTDLTEEALETISKEAEELRDLASVKSVSTITDVMPTHTQRERRLPYLKGIRTTVANQQSAGTSSISSASTSALLEELYRLESNLVEMGDMLILGGSSPSVAFALNRITGRDNDGKKVGETYFDALFNSLEEGGSDVPQRVGEFQSIFTPQLQERIYRMANPEEITLKTLPPVIRDSFVATDQMSGLTIVSPTKNPWEGGFRNIFASQVQTITDEGTALIFAADSFISATETDSVITLVGAIIAVFCVLLIDFRNLKLVILSFIPLFLAMGSLFGLMALIDLKLNFMNMIAIPLLIGMGIDISVHINHRYLQEGKGGMKTTIGETGTAIAITTLTTIIGFASFITSIVQGLRGLGIILTLAMALAFLFSTLFHPALLIMVSEKWGWDLSPWGSKKKK